MQVVISIDDNLYTRLFDNGDEYVADMRRACVAIRKGTPLPKGHGRLIDADYLKDVILLHNFHGNNKNIVPYSDRRGYRLRQREIDEAIINVQTIIEADKIESEE
jgi:hypothetical protein